MRPVRWGKNQKETTEVPIIELCTESPPLEDLTAGSLRHDFFSPDPIYFCSFLLTKEQAAFIAEQGSRKYIKGIPLGICNV